MDATYSLNVVRDFFYAMKGRLHGFRFKDFTDYKDNSGGRLGSGSGDGTTKIFQMVKRYTTGAQSIDRQIKKPVSATIQIFVNGVLKTLTTDYTIDSTTGIVTFVTAPGAGLSVTWTGQFDVPVRFDTDELSMHMEGGLYVISSLRCIELRL